MSLQNRLAKTQTKCQHWSAATLWPPCLSAAYAHTPTHSHTYFSPLTSVDCVETLGDWPPPCTPISLFSLPSRWPPQRQTIVYFHSPSRPCWSGGPGESLHYCLVLPCAPLPSRPSLTPFTALKSTICITQQSGSKREGETGQEEERKQGGKKGDDG